MKKNHKAPIVCGTDFSATAMEAMDIAAALARRLKTRLLLVHVDQLHRSLVSDPIIVESAALQTRCEMDREVQRLCGLGTDVGGKIVLLRPGERPAGRKGKPPAVLRFKYKSKAES